MSHSQVATKQKNEDQQHTAGMDQNGRRRGRARGRIQWHAVSSTSSGLNKNLEYNNAQGESGHVEDAITTVTLTGENNCTKNRMVTNNVFQSADNKEHFSSKEKGSILKPLRSKRANFDSGVMSRINNILQHGVNVKSDAHASTSPDKLHESNSQRFRLSSPSLRLKIPAKTISDSEQAITFPKQIAASDQSYSMSHSPTSLQGDNDLPYETRNPEPVPLTSKQHLITPAESKVPFHAKVRGRGHGWARGRARSRQQMELTPEQKVVCEIECDIKSQSLCMDSAKFADEHTISTLLESFKINNSPTSQPVLSHSSYTANTLSSIDIYSSEVIPSLEDNEQFEDACDIATIPPASQTVDKNDKCKASKVNEDMSDLAEDITQLLSPDHKYVLDWAAAMETPTPDTSVSVLNWNLSNEQ